MAKIIKRFSLVVAVEGTELKAATTRYEMQSSLYPELVKSGDAEVAALKSSTVSEAIDMAEAAIKQKENI